jgi:hypothetical protein
MIQVEMADALAPLFMKKARYRVAFGGRASTKSHGFSGMLIAECYRQPTRALCARQFQSSIKASVHQLLVDKIEQGKYPGFKITDTEIRHNNGSKIIFKGLEKSINEVKSMEGVNICWVEEAQNVPKSSWDILIPTIRDEGSEIWVTFNPVNKTDYTSQIFIEKPLPGALIKKVNYTENPWFWDSPLVQEMQYCKALDIDDYNHIWLGEYKNPNKGGRVVSGWSFANIEEVPYDPYCKLHLTCDFNVDPMCWEIAHVRQIKNQFHFHFFDEIARGPSGIVDAAQEFYARYKGHKGGIVITGDASGNSRSDTTAQINQKRYELLMQTLSDLGMSMENVALDSPRSNPHKPVRHQAFNRAVYDHFGLRRVKIHPRCKRLISNCEELRYIPGSSEIWQPSSKQIEKNNDDKWLRQDPYDAASYLVYQQDPKFEYIDENYGSQVRAVEFKAS